MVKPFFKEETLPPTLPKSSIHKKPDSPIQIGTRVYDFISIRAFKDCGNFEVVYPVHAEMRQRGREDIYDVEVLIYWEAMYGDTKYPPSKKVLFSLARNAIESHFLRNNYPMRFSAIRHPIAIKVQPCGRVTYDGPF